MAEIRKHNPEDADGLGKLVRDALGERVRPHEPGRDPQTSEEEKNPDEDLASGAATWSSWTGNGEGFTF